jgi:hypothetical protein
MFQRHACTAIESLAVRQSVLIDECLENSEKDAVLNGRLRMTNWCPEEDSNLHGLLH